MAARKSNKKTVPALDLAAIVAATQNGTFVYTSVEAHATALNDGLVEVNPSMTNEAGELATRATQKGIEAMSQTQAPAAAPTAKPAFAIEDNVPLAAVVGRGRGGETYPFDKLAVGQSFFVPDSDGKQAAKSMASTVSSATRRYAEVIPGETRKNRKGEDVPATKETRKFVLRAVTENGVSGARIWRTQ